MATNRGYTIIGAFIIGALVLAVIAVLAFGGIHVFSQPRQAVIFFNQSVLGLSDGSRVLFRGVQIGTVKHMELRLGPRARRARIAVTIEVSPNNIAKLNGAPVSSSLTTAQLVKRGLRAQLVTWSYVTSELAVNLTFEPGTRAHYTVNPKKLEFPEIPAIPSEIQQLKKTISKVPWQQAVKNLNQTLKTMISLARGMNQTVSRMAPRLEQTNNSAQKTLNTIRQAVASNNKQLQATIRSMHLLASNANTALAARNKQIAALLASAQKTGKNMQKLSQNLEGLTRPGSATHENLKSALRDLAASAANLRQFSETIARDPHALLFGD